LIYLKLSVSGHFKIFQTRTRGPFWSLRPAPILLVAVLGTQAVATLIAVYGLFMSPIGWGWALMVWGYSSVWFLFNDRMKILAYRVFDRTKANPKILANDEKLNTDLTLRIAKRAYEIYEKRGNQKELAAQDWKQAEMEILKK
jgi:H+-transporting ATPase